MLDLLLTGNALWCWTLVLPQLAKKLLGKLSTQTLGGEIEQKCTPKCFDKFLHFPQALFVSGSPTLT